MLNDFLKIKIQRPPNTIEKYPKIMHNNKKPEMDPYVY
jgi:hypothetical protein